MLAKDKIIELLERIPRTRDNDNLLIAYYIKEVYGLQNTFDIALHTNKNLYETVRRTRQRVQEENPMLRGQEETIKARANKETLVREEMRGL